MRRLVRWILPANLPKGGEGVVSAIADEVLTSGGAFSLVPIGRGPVLAWGWVPGVVAAAAVAHPEVDEQMLGTDETRGRWLDQAQLLLHGEHEALLDSVRWSEVWAWRLDRPAVRGTQQMQLADYWPQTEPVGCSDQRSDWAVPDCFSLYTVADDVQETAEDSSAASLPGRG